MATLDIGHWKIVVCNEIFHHDKFLNFIFSDRLYGKFRVR